MRYSKFRFILFFIIGAVLSAQGREIKRPIDYVDPNIGTAHCRWFFYTPAAVPFGMAKLAPSTDAHLGNADGWQAVGYDFRHTSIEGFANFHEFQVGGWWLHPLLENFKPYPARSINPKKAIVPLSIKKTNMLCRATIRFS